MSIPSFHSVGNGSSSPGGKSDYSLPSISKIKNIWGYTSTPSYVLTVIKQKKNSLHNLEQKTAVTLLTSLGMCKNIVK